MNRVLVVEDERVVAVDLRETLREHGFEVVATTALGEEAVELAREHRPSLILMDVRLAGEMDGVEAARRIKLDHDVPVVFLTASTDLSTHERLRPLAAAVLMKPFSEEELPRVLNVARDRYDDIRREQRRHQELATTLQCIGDAVITTNSRGIIDFVNPAAERLLQVSKSQACGRQFGDVVHLADSDGVRIMDPVSACLQSLRRVQLPLDCLLIRADGARVPVGDTAAPILEGDELLGVVVVMQDVTLRRQLTEKMAHAERLASMGLMASSIAHEINTPLTTVRANLEWLSARLADDHDAREVVTETEAGARRIGRVIQDLRRMSASKLDTRGETDLAEVLHRAIRLAKPERFDLVSVTTDIPESLPIRGSEAAMGQVAVNLIVNASQAVQDAGEGRVHIAAARDDSRTWFIVRDDGPGVPEHLHYKIFEPFFTTRDVGEGTGLGLSISRRIVEAHGGQLTVHNHPDGGTIARVALPHPERAAEPGTGAHELRPRQHLLIVDDNEILLKAIVRQLSRRHDVQAAVSAEEALERIAEDKFDLVLSDVMMPEVHGLELARMAIERQPDLASRWMLMTGGVLSPDLTEAIEEAGYPMLRKPFSVAELERFLATLPAAT